MLQVITDAIEDAALHVHTQHIMSDLELGIIKSAEEIFGNIVSACFFHLSQSIAIITRKTTPLKKPFICFVH